MTSQEKLKNLRSKMLIHSYLYYVLDSPIIADVTYDRWAKELADMPYEKIGFYDKEFKDWDGSTGYHLPRNLWVEERASILLNTHRKYYEQAS